MIDALHPQALWLLLLVPVFWWAARRQAPPWHRALRCAIAACIVLALAQPGLLRRTGAVRRVFVIDQKAALVPASRDAARALLRRRLAGVAATDKVTVVQLGGTPIALAAGHPVMVDGPGEASSLSAALAAAVRAIPLGAAGAVTLITDGRSSDAHWERSLDALVRRGIAVDTVPLDPPSDPARIDGLRVGSVRTGETATATVAVEGHGAGLRVDLLADGRPVASSGSFAVDGTREVALRFTAGRPGFQGLRATLAGAAGVGAAVETVAAIQPPLRLLYLGGREAGAVAPLGRLLGRGVAVDARDPAAVGAGFDLSPYRAVMIDDVPAAQVAPAAQRRLLDAVRTGGLGLFYAGGQASFGPGGWDRTPLAAALPVTLRQDERVEKPSVALAIVIDSSGSMGGERMEIAKQIAVLAARKLGPQDSIGVVEFYGAKQWAIPMQPVRDIAAIERGIGHIEASGSSVLLPAIQEAYYGLKDADARFKHILVLSDGGVSDGAFEQLIRHIADSRINLSTVAIEGEEADAARMMDWARWGHGRFYSVTDGTGLVQIDLAPPQTSPEPGYRDGETRVRIAPAGSWWEDMGRIAPPPLAGHVRVGRRSDAETLMETDGGDPVLASWQYGSGRVTALMTEPLGRGTAGWAAWPRYGEWLARAVARTAGPSSSIAVDIARRFDRLAFVLQRLDGIQTAGAPVAMLVDAAGRPAARVALEEKAPGLFTGSVAWPAERDALLRVTDAGTTVFAADRARSDVVPGAMSARGALPLDALSRLTGGRVVAGGDGPGTTVTGGDVGFLALWSWLALLALGLYIAEIACRRWPRGRHEKAIAS